MGKDKEISWLYSELPSLVEKGVITEEAASKMREHYGEPDRQKSRNLVFIISGVLGSILIGLGIILLFAYNWDEYSRTTRTILSFIPLIVAEIIFGYSYFCKRNAAAWMESASGFLMLMVGSCLSLVGQIYNIGGTLSELLFIWLLLSIPLIYLSNTVLPYIIYMILLTWWSFIADDAVNRWNMLNEYLPADKLCFLLLALAVFPHFYKNTDRTRFTSRGNLMGWFFAVSIFIASSNVFVFGGGLATLFYNTCLGVLLYILGKVFYDTTNHFWQKPFQVIGIAAVFILAVSCTFEDYWKEFSEDSWLFGSLKFNHSARVVLYIIACMFSTISILIAYNRYRKKLPLNYFPLIFPVIIAIGIVIAHYYADYLVAIILCNLFVLAFSVFYIYKGMKQEKISLVNAGMFFLSVLILVRFFSDNIGFLFKGIVFILIGCSFLLVNYFLMKRRQKNG